jgi:NitT/TauT family transport system substrate-binding protein
MQIMQSRRSFLTTASTAFAAGLAGASRSARAEPPPETTTVCFGQVFGVDCDAAKSIAGALLQAEGFTDVRYVTPDDPDPRVTESLDWFADGIVDFDSGFPTWPILTAEAGSPITVLAGMHAGCLELIANDSVQTVTDLKGKRVGTEPYMTSRALLRLMAAYVGLDVERDIEWVVGEETPPLELFAQGKVDAFLAVASEPQRLRARKIVGHTIVNSTIDRPWSQYFCCMLAGRPDYVTNYPVATKRVLRAILKSADLCASNPARAAQRLVDGGVTSEYEIAKQALKDIRYDAWRNFDPEDTLRFYALRMREAGMITSDPNEIIARHTEWSFLNELKTELKG